MSTTVEITWRGTRPVTDEELDSDVTFARNGGYAVHCWGEVNRAQQLVVLCRIMAPAGTTVALYETSYGKS